jgi:hypothetical protein
MTDCRRRPPVGDHRYGRHMPRRLSRTTAPTPSPTEQWFGFSHLYPVGPSSGPTQLSWADAVRTLPLSGYKQNEPLVEPARVRQSVLYMPSSNHFINKAVRASLKMWA